MAFETIATDLSPRGIATITLDRPDRGNAFNQRMLDELGGQFSAWAGDSRVRVVVLRARGKHFCVGADVAAMAAKPAGDAAEAAFTLNDTLVAIDTIPKPTIAVVEGGCVGGGLAFAACCDVVLATESAFFSVPEVRLGMVPGLAPLFARALGPRALRRYALSGERFSAAEALRLGFVHDICEAAKLDEDSGGADRCFPSRCARRDRRIEGDGGVLCGAGTRGRVSAEGKPQAAFRPVARSDRRHCRLPRKAQAELVSAMRLAGRADRRGR